ncbi:MAG TPA: type II toxin-antitoxin system VapC family toxin [Chthoniobacteraceae bacterium]|nr:type II toxin-antitoxin system VapC family toxin [Chthoniobacteraceae bacterium]
MIADSTVLIDLWRLRRAPHRLVQLRAQLIDPMVPWQVLFEFVRGAYFRGVTEAAIRRFLSPFGVLPGSEAQTWRAARIDADLNLAGKTIGAADCWIAAAGLEENLPVITRNLAHFQRVPGLQVIGYSILP